MSFVLLFSVFVIATCGLIYELIAAALASYLLGDSITQFSTVIGAYLFAMGIGSYLSKYLHRNLLTIFIQVELLIALVGGFSATVLFLSFEHVAYFRVLLYGLVGITGMLVGLEIPLLMRILKSQFEFKDLVSKVFTYDYIGALVASVLFPLFLVPHLGLVRTAFLFGFMNAAVALWALILFAAQIPWARLQRGATVLVLVVLATGFVMSERILSFAEASSYPGQVVYTKSSKHQRIVLSKVSDDWRLYLNGNLQFSSRDEYRYHEALVHVGMTGVQNPKSVLILGGGDGFAAREVLKYPSVEEVVLVDLDPVVTELFSTHPVMVEMNMNSLLSPKVKIENRDAFVWIKENTKKFDYVVVDFPDPTNFSVGKLYTNAFYRQLKGALAPNGLIAIQSTSPYVAKKSFWCVNRTLQSVGFSTRPYHVYVPAFGDWGYILAGHQDFELSANVLPGLRFVRPELIPTFFVFPPDMLASVDEINKLNNQVLVRTFEEEWSKVHLTE